MEFSNYCTDLYILPGTSKETNNLQSYCITNKINYQWNYANVEGHDWNGKRFLEIPCGVHYKKQIKEYFSK